MDNKNATKREQTNEQLDRLVGQQARGAALDLDVSLTDLDMWEDGELDYRVSKNAVSSCKASFGAYEG